MLRVATMSRQTEEIKLAEEASELHFCCLRCADLCCKLGGPPLLQEDEQRIRTAHPEIADHIVSGAERFGSHDMLRSNERGECICLSFDLGISFCTIYQHRPTACREFPFVVRRSEDCVELYAVPCRGLNNFKGIRIDSRFVKKAVCTSRDSKSLK